MFSFLKSVVKKTNLNIFLKLLINIKFPGTNFDKEYYLNSNLDVLQDNINPYLHYLFHGKNEGRYCSPPKLIITGKQAFDSNKETILIVSHDASRTGAPILAWNICKELSSKYNVIALLLGPGEISKNFEEVATTVIETSPAPIRDTASATIIINNICSLYSIKFSIVNSAASTAVLKPLAENFIPSVTLIHEFFSYMPSSLPLSQILLWSKAVVFPSKMVQQNALNENYSHLLGRTHIFPQGKSSIPDLNLKTPEKNNLIALIKELSQKYFIVLGAGTVLYRKGVDLFIATAREINRLDPTAKILMIWVGKDYDIEKDKNYSTFLYEQIHYPDTLENFKLFNAISNFEEIYQYIKVFYLPSRLDPLPNVGIDTMSEGIPTICFEHCSGLAEYLSKDSETASCVLPPANIQKAAETIIQLYQSNSYHRQIGQKCRELAKQNFNMSAYILNLIDLANNQISATTQESNDINFIKNSGEFIANFYNNTLQKTSTEQLITSYVRSWHAQIEMRKPSPGFNPHIYSEANQLKLNQEPFTHYISSGKPKGEWQDDLIVPHTKFGESKLNCAVHIHVFYAELFEDIFKRLTKSKIKLDYFISAATNEIKDKVFKIINKANVTNCYIEVVPNRGRDIGPFFTQFGALLQNYQIIGHFHTKKTTDVANQKTIALWRNFLLENLIGGFHPMLDQIIYNFEEENSLGLVYADDPFIIGWGNNKIFAEKLIENFKEELSLPKAAFNFPVGTMFWARPQALKPLFDLNLKWDNYPEEPLPYDGSILHAIERLIPLVAKHQKFKQKTTFIPKLSR